MKPGLCHFSGFKIHPGRGQRFVRADSKTFMFFSPKSKVAFMRKGNPRRCVWTAIYRKLHHKGSSNKEAKKSKTRRGKRVERAIVGASLDLLKQRRAETPEQRKAALAASKAKKIEALKKRKEAKKAIKGKK
eukprot:TRINITY_DN959_c0_g1_i1.p1 TRINITY_DN959_c0_g1~~TRINITY_DN959_c0_g1_i1.p1  ORF type:complete len:132 (+),score=54.74 TRINITY_DN959_c0_g1_i1:113-508(+)